LRKSCRGKLRGNRERKSKKGGKESILHICSSQGKKEVAANVRINIPKISIKMEYKNVLSGDMNAAAPGWGTACSTRGYQTFKRKAPFAFVHRDRVTSFSPLVFYCEEHTVTSPINNIPKPL
jgi:hypothetical protein